MSSSCPAERVLVLLYPGFTEFEIAVATTILARRFEIVTVGLDGALVTGEGGLRCLPHLAVGDVQAEGCAGLVLPGAPDFRTAWESEAATC